MMTVQNTGTLTTGGLIVAYRRLDHEARERIMCLLAADAGVSWTQIGTNIGVHRSTIQREVHRNGGRRAYQAARAQHRAEQMATRRHRFIFDKNPTLAEEVTGLLKADVSPVTISHRVSDSVSAETIYRGVYGGRLDVQPHEVLRYRHRKRRHRHLRQPPNDGNYLGDFISIRDRPAHIETRTEVGHWEGDLVMGPANKSAIVSLTERCSRFQVCLDLPDGHTADATIARLHQWIGSRGPLIKSLTWDRGAELTRWQQLCDTYGIGVYFCDPKSPWQRASNENQNRLLRFWFPKGHDLSVFAQHDLDHAADVLNTTNRRIHNWATAHDLYHQHARTKE